MLPTLNLSLNPLSFKNMVFIYKYTYLHVYLYIDVEKYICMSCITWLVEIIEIVYINMAMGYIT